jgi:hypothetical protein
VTSDDDQREISQIIVDLNNDTGVTVTTMLRLRTNRGTPSPPKATSTDGVENGPSIKKRHMRQKKQTKISPHVVAIGFLIVATILEVVYLAVLGAFQDAALWNSLVTSLWKSSSSLGTPLDNYYSRPHIRTPVPLIVGGSDGSGTRAFVQVLEQLEVPMVIDDRGTMDVHAKEIFNGAGWPALVSQVLNVTHAATYNVEELPESLTELALQELGKLSKALEMRGRMMYQTGAGKVMASGVAWGFKAPVSILLLPFFRKRLPAFKLLHIVRDGRDVALSDNHSPVRKFYPSYYQDSDSRHEALVEEDFGQESRARVKAIQLWNDWNKQVYDYGVRYSDGKTLDVLVMRTEDLLEQSFESLSMLADFVGSPLSPYRLCCMSRTGTTDLGQSGIDLLSDRFGGGSLRGRQSGTDGFEKIRERFEEFVPKEFQKAWERKHPGNSFDQEVKQKLLGGENDMVLSESEAKSVEHLDLHDGDIPRRLSEEVENDDKIDVFKSGGKRASPVIHALNIKKNTVDDLIGNSGQFDQLNRMQKIIEERRGDASTAKKPQSTEQVKQRYGKWVKTLKGDPILSERLHREGEDTLRLLGYEPPRPFLDTNKQLWKCDSSVVCQ